MSAKMIDELFPNDLFSNGRKILQKYGHGSYESHSKGELWEYLKGDFSVKTHGDIPDYNALNTEQRQAADRYIEILSVTRDLLQRCEDLHMELLTGGINPDLVEVYTLARDEYEDTVEDFGGLREELDALL